MYTSSEIQEKILKSSNKKDLELLLNELSSDYDSLQQENVDLKKTIKDLSDSIGYYKSIERTLQRALILAEKAAQETRSTAIKEAEVIEQEARAKSKLILMDSKKQIEILEHKFLNLIQQYDLFKIHFKNLLNAQNELISSNCFSVNTDDFTYFEEQQNRLESDNEQIPSTENKENLEQASDYLLDPDQISLAFLKETEVQQSYQTEDGFEFIQMEDNRY